MDKKKSILNVTVSVGFKLATMVLAILVKRILIDTCGNEVNGLNALYLSIIGVLSVAELGLGTAITFSMYKPIVEGNINQVSALYRLFQKLYWAIGGFILAAGLCLTPFLHYLAKDYTQLNVNLYTTFFLMLFSVVLTYLFSAKLALFNAYKNNYITTAITSGGSLLQYVLQIGVLLLFRSFSVYLICRSITALVQWMVTEWLVRRSYQPVLTTQGSLDAETKSGLIKSIKAMFIHKVGYVLVNSVDSIVISMFIGVVSLGAYSNYITIMTSMNGVLSLIFTSLTSVVGHLYVSETKQRASEYCKVFHTINFLLGTVFFLGCYAVIDDTIAILFSENLIVPRSVSFTVVLNGFVQFMRQTVLVFRDATGTFYYDRWKPLVEGVVNVVFSVLLVNMFGVVGVIAATIATNLCICHVIEPYVLYRKAFEQSPARYYGTNYGQIVLFVLMMVLFDGVRIAAASRWVQFFVNGSLSVVVSCIAGVIILTCDRKLGKEVFGILKKKR